MSSKKIYFTKRQLTFQELFIGTLLYAVVLGFFNDYTSLVYAKSFSTVFFAAIVLEILTYLAFQLKSMLVAWLREKNGAGYKALLFFSVWCIMFLSKFVFVWALDAIFGEYIHINGFFGILSVVVCVTVIHRLAYYVFKRLG